MTKYLDGVSMAQRQQLPVAELPPFDIERLRSKGLTRRLFASAFEDPRWALALARRFKPTIRIGGWVYVTKDQDVREVLERQDEFETPYGPEMTEIAGGSNFILGMKDGPGYRRMKSSVLSAFPVDEVEAVVRPMAARHARDVM